MKWLNSTSRKFLERGYLPEGVTPEKRIRDIAEHAEKILKIDGFADKFEYYMSQGYYSLSSPVWANFGLKRGLPISCFTSYVPDSLDGILYTLGEVGMMTKYGGGTAGYFGDLRPRGADISGNGTSSGSVHFMQLFDTGVNVVSQGSVRRGAFACYYPVEGKDILEFLEIKTEGNPIQNLQTGVTVGDEFLKSLKDNEENRKIWAKVIQSRSEIGTPYIFFKDNANNGTIQEYKDGGYEIKGSNLCSEIMLPTSENESFVCCLSSMNIAEYDSWKDTDAVRIMTLFLDTVMQDFIDKLERLEEGEAKNYMKRALRFAKNHRALGLGTLGYHTYLQKKAIPFESPEASELNIEIHKVIKEQAYDASKELKDLFGTPEGFPNLDRRNTTLMAIAPTTSSAFILGQVSQSIEPIWSNCYVKDLAKMKVTVKNPQLEELLESKGMNTKEVWDKIRLDDGSVQKLDFLSQREKDIFKTFVEINQYTIIDQASDRQKFIDQGQSLNLMIHPDTPAKDINALYLDAWRQGIKSLYYQHSKSASQELARKVSCVSCEA